MHFSLFVKVDVRIGVVLMRALPGVYNTAGDIHPAIA